MIKLKYALIAVLASNLYIAYYCSSIIDDLHIEITHLNKLLNGTDSNISYWNHDGEWKRITYNDRNIND